MNVYFSTVIRRAPVENSGELVKMDWNTKEILAKVPVRPGPPEFIDPNPRGNGRGGRGILKLEDRLIVASYHTLYQYDFDLNPMGKICNNLFVGLHELAPDEKKQNIWAASTAIDAAVCVDFNGQTSDHWWSREEELLVEKYNLTPLEIDKEKDNRILWLHNSSQKSASHTHLNAICIHRDEIYVLLNTLGIIYNVSSGKILLEMPCLQGAHNLSISEDVLMVNLTRDKSILVYDMKNRSSKIIDMTAFSEIQEIINKDREQKETPTEKIIFMRGLCRLDDSRVLAGFSPAGIAEIDFKSGKLLDLFQYSDNVYECVHGLTAL